MRLRRPGPLLAALLGLGCPRRDDPPPPALQVTPSAASLGPVRGVETPRAPEVLPDFPAALSDHWEPLGEGVVWRGTEVAFPECRIAAPGGVRRLRWVVVRVDLSRTTLRVEPVEAARFASLADDPTVRGALNAGFFEPDLRPSGAMVSEGRLLHPPTSHGGTGLVAITHGRARLVPIARDAGVDALPDGADLVVQCTPRLIEADGSVGIHRDDGRRAARSVLCLREGGRILDLIAAWDPDAPGNGPGLWHLARRLAAPSPVGDPAGCEGALNLDGGPSTAMLVRPSADRRFLHPGRGPVPWALVLRTR